MRLFTRFDRYLARLIAVPLLSTLVTSAMLLLLDRMLRLFRFVVTEGGPVSVVWRMLGNLLPEYLGLGIPIGLTLGILLGFRNIALSSELDALRSVGVSYNRLLRVPYMFAIGLTLLNLFIVGWLQPTTRYNYEGLRFDLRSGALGASIKVGEFAKIGKMATLRVEQSRDGGRDLRGVFLRTQNDKGESLAVTADHGTFLSTDDPNVLLLRLTSGVLVQDGPGYQAPRVLRFTRNDLPIDLPKMESFRDRGSDTDELTMDELIGIARGTRPANGLYLPAIADLQQRIVQCAVMLVLPLLAVALAVPPKRSSSALGVFLGIVLIVTYYKITQYAQRMGAIGKVDPLMAQWIPFALFCLFCGWMYYVLAFKPGGQPIGGLDRMFSRISKAVGRLVRPGGWRDSALSAG